MFRCTWPIDLKGNLRSFTLRFFIPPLALSKTSLKVD
jgi:hypothetical protein